MIIGVNAHILNLTPAECPNTGDKARLLERIDTSGNYFLARCRWGMSVPPGSISPMPSMKSSFWFFAKDFVIWLPHLVPTFSEYFYTSILTLYHCPFIPVITISIFYLQKKTIHGNS